MLLLSQEAKAEGSLDLLASQLSLIGALLADARHCLKGSSEWLLLGTSKVILRPLPKYARSHTYSRITN